MPTLRAIPSDYQIDDGTWYRCYLREDALAIVTELKAACLAHGQSAELCQATARPIVP